MRLVCIRMVLQYLTGINQDCTSINKRVARLNMSKTIFTSCYTANLMFFFYYMYFICNENKAMMIRNLICAFVVPIRHNRVFS